jgi:S-DNA-T family DNA segregation ATPase FtsK/SpoIIIE
MKANIPGRIAFSVASVIDSRTILDSPGAEKLLGRGDMLYSCAELSRPVRIQGAFISEEEMKRVVDYLKGDEEPEYDESIVGSQTGSATGSMFGGPTDEQDALFEDAKRFVIQAGKASASLLQRRMKVGYARAARLLDELEQAGIVGPADGAKPREVFVTDEGESGTMNTGQELNVFSAPETEAEDEKEAELDDEDAEDEELEDEEEEDAKGKALPF